MRTGWTKTTRRESVQKTDTIFIVRGRVGKGIYHNNKNGVETTSFNIGVVKGKLQNSQNYDWESIPILAFGNHELYTGEYVVATGRIGINRKEKQVTPILLCDAIAKLADGTRAPDKPQTPDERSDNFYNNEDFTSDVNIPF